MECKATQNMNTTDDEVSLLDIINFLYRNWRLLTLIFVSLSVLALFFLGLQPKSYKKALSFKVNNLLIPADIAPISPLDINLMSNMATEFVMNYYKKQGTKATAKYTPQTQSIAVSLVSVEKKDLEQADIKIENLVKTNFEATIKLALQQSALANQIAITKNKVILDQLQKEINQSIAIQTNITDPESFQMESLKFKLEALETKRTDYIAEFANLEFNRQYLVDSQENLSQFTSQIILSEILTESEIQTARSFLKIGLLVVISSFTISVLVAILKEQLFISKTAEVLQSEID